MTPTEYQENAEITKSNSYYGEYITIREMVDTLNVFIEATAKLDKLKKKLFYGRGIGLTDEGQMPVRSYALGQTLSAINGLTGRDETIIHSLLGLATEGGENAEILRDWFAHFLITGKVQEWDCVKLAEEAGGMLWYAAIQSNATGISMEQVFEINIAQLRSRFKGKFDAAEANKRNLEAEHAALVAATPKTTMVDAAAPKGFNNVDNLVAHQWVMESGKADDEIERHRSQNAI